MISVYLLLDIRCRETGGVIDYVTECLVETLGFSVSPSHQILSEK